MRTTLHREQYSLNNTLRLICLVFKGKELKIKAPKTKIKKKNFSNQIQDSRFTFGSTTAAPLFLIMLAVK